MTRIAVLAAALWGLGAPLAQAQDWREIAWYGATIGTDDLYNSRGTRLTDPGAVIQQDRANYHRFGLRQQGDMGDPVFHDRAARARIPGLVDFGAAPGFVADVRAGRPSSVEVYVCGRGSAEVMLVIDRGAQGGHSGCF